MRNRDRRGMARLAIKIARKFFRCGLRESIEESCLARSLWITNRQLCSKILPRLKTIPVKKNVYTGKKAVSLDY